MLKPIQFWVLAGVAILGLILVAVNIRLVVLNRDSQASISARAQYIQQSVQLQSLYQEIVKAEADLAVRNKDEQLRDLLSRNGMSISITPTTAAGGTAAAPGTAKGKQ
jgi:capsular polysaccharide biosynthesis protein